MEEAAFSGIDSEDRRRGTGVGAALTQTLKPLNEIGCRSYIRLVNVTWKPWHITHTILSVPGGEQESMAVGDMDGIP